MSHKKLWDKGTGIDEKIEAFTVGSDRELDLELAKYDVQGTMAHIEMLESVGLLEARELEQLKNELGRIMEEEIETGKFEIEQGIEDVHSQIEFMLTERLGEVGKKVHAGRSRNDQVLTDLRLFFKDQIGEIVTLSRRLFDTLIGKSEATKDVLMPGYTHMQAAMPGSFGLWFGAYAESLTDDLEILRSVYNVVNRNPLGSGAGYGSSFPLNRQQTTERLGFESMVYNSVYAQKGRGKTEFLAASAIATIAGTLNKLASDVCLFNSQNFGFLKLPDELTTGSSIMPHKKNPDVFELIRAKTNRLRALPNEIQLLTGNLPSGYHRDFQLLKEQLFPCFTVLKSCLDIADYAVQRIEVNKEILEDPKYTLIFSVEAVNRLVADGIPFREAYQRVGKQIEDGSFEAPDDLNHTHEGSIGNLMLDEIRERMKRVMEQFTSSK